MVFYSLRFLEERKRHHCETSEALRRGQAWPGAAPLSWTTGGVRWRANARGAVLNAQKGKQLL